MTPSRRFVLASLLSLPFARGVFAETAARELAWDELIPEGVPYSQIVADGERDEVNDRWLPIFDMNAYRFVESLTGTRIRMPGFLLPLETGPDGVTEFILTPYAGACVHVPPPPPNQLVFTRTATPWQNDGMFDPIWVTGILRVDPLTTDLAEIGYTLQADLIERYEWS